MIGQASETYVAEAIALQGVIPTEGAPKLIAAGLSAQLAAAAPAYASLPFEAEPSGLCVALEREKA
jgi:hypothetical protein